MTALGSKTLEPLDGRPIVVGQIAARRSRHSAEARAGRRWRATFVFAGQQTIRQRAERDQPEVVSPQHRHHLAIEPTGEQAILLLARDEAVEAERRRCPSRLDDLPGWQGRTADVADLPLPDEIVERPQRLLDWRQRVRLVLLVEIDPVGLEAPQARLDLGHD